MRAYAGGYDDWLRQRSVASETEPDKVKSPRKTANQPSNEQQRRISFKEKQELAELPPLIENLEAQIATLHESMAAADYFQQSGEILAADKKRLSDWQEQLATALQRWCELEELVE